MAIQVDHETDPPASALRPDVPPMTLDPLDERGRLRDREQRVRRLKSIACDHERHQPDGRGEVQRERDPAERVQREKRAETDQKGPTSAESGKAICQPFTKRPLLLKLRFDVLGQ